MKMSLSFPSKISLAQLPTPLQPLPRLSKMFGGPNIWVKRDDLTEFGAGGNKIRKLEYMFAEAVSQQAGVIITCGGVQSNHCRATALLAARLGFKCHLILRGQQPDLLDANTLISHVAGAKLSYYPLSQYQNLSDLFEYWSNHYLELSLKAYCIPTGASDEVGLWGYVEAASELLNDFKEHKLDGAVHVCCATGSGGTHAGLALGMHLSRGLADVPEVTGFAVCDNREYFSNKAREDFQRWQLRYRPQGFNGEIHMDICDEFIGPGYAKAYPELLQTIELVAQTEGLLLDPVYTGKAFHGMLERLKHGKFSHVKNLVFVHTGGAFGLLPFRDSFTSN